MSEEKKGGEKKVEEKREAKLHVERLFTIPLHDIDPNWRRSAKAVTAVRLYLVRHMKTSLEKIHLDSSINEEIFRHGARKPPHRIQIRAMKFEDGVVEAELKGGGIGSADASHKQ